MVVVLMDPDQLILRPLTHDYSDIDMKWIQPRSANHSKLVQHKSTIAQQYGFGSKWITEVNLSHLLPNDTVKRESPLWTLRTKTAAKFAAGPPYLATALDMYSIVKTWVDFAPRVQKELVLQDALLAEIFAYNLAAHHVNLRPLMSASFMVSDVSIGVGEEGWHWIEEN
jgi:hypothetical protein